jgi:hypothetical protein
MYICIYIHTYIYIYKTRLASNEIFSPLNKIHQEVGRAKDLSARRYVGAQKSIQDFGVKTWIKEKLRRPWRRWQNSINKDLKETWWEGTYSIHRDQHQGRDKYQALVKTAMNVWVPKTRETTRLITWGNISSSRKTVPWGQLVGWLVG